jgi:cytochrome c biogenesis protein CcdA
MIDLDKLPGMDLVKHFLSFGIFAIVIAGLIDGINPCAFTVIVFFISFLAFQGYKKRELLLIGLSFIFAVFLTYVLIGLGIFRFLYALRNFYFITKTIYYLIGAFCFLLGIFAIYDFWLLKKTGVTEGMFLQLPRVIKNRIHAIIGTHYRKASEERKTTVSSGGLVGLIVSAFITGFLVSLLEAVCTGQLYLPTIAFVLKEATLRVRAFGYLLLYNLMFTTPLLVVLALALLGTTSEGFSRFTKKHMAAIKISMAILFFGLGTLILIGS